MVICFEEYVLFRWDLYSVIYGLVVLQRRRTDIRLPRLAVYDINHTLNPINSADSWNRTTDLWLDPQCSTSELSRPPNLSGFLLDVMVICFEEYVLFRWDLYSVIYGLVVLQRRRTDIRLPRLAVYDINHTLNPINSADSWNRTTDLWARSPMLYL